MNTNALKDPDTFSAICAHLRACEEALLRPEFRRDRVQVAALLAEDFLEIGSSGRLWTRDQILDLLAIEDYQPPAIEDFQCAWIAEAVVLVTYRTVRVDSHSGARFQTLRSSVWTKKDGEWLLRFHQGTKTA